MYSLLCVLPFFLRRAGHHGRSLDFMASEKKAGVLLYSCTPPIALQGLGHCTAPGWTHTEVTGAYREGFQLLCV